MVEVGYSLSTVEDGFGNSPVRLHVDRDLEFIATGVTHRVQGVIPSDGRS